MSVNMKNNRVDEREGKRGMGWREGVGEVRLKMRIDSA